MFTHIYHNIFPASGSNDNIRECLFLFSFAFHFLITSSIKLKKKQEKLLKLTQRELVFIVFL